MTESVRFTSLATWFVSTWSPFSPALKDRLPAMSEDEQLALLASDGMLVKRPLLIGRDFVLAGFKEAEWEQALKG